MKKKKKNTTVVTFAKALTVTADNHLHFQRTISKEISLNLLVYFFFQKQSYFMNFFFHCIH